MQMLLPLILQQFSPFISQMIQPSFYAEDIATEEPQIDQSHVKSFLRSILE